MLYMRPALETVQRFIGIQPAPVATDTVLASVLFTDIVGSTQRQAEIGDRGWKVLVERHNAIARASLREWRGVENDTAGDGFDATFDGPVCVIRCGLEISERVRDLGIEVRAGVVRESAKSWTVRLLGSRFRSARESQPWQDRLRSSFRERSKTLLPGAASFLTPWVNELKGIPDRWNIFSVTDGDS